MGIFSKLIETVLYDKAGPPKIDTDLKSSSFLHDF